MKPPPVFSLSQLVIHTSDELRKATILRNAKIASGEWKDVGLIELKECELELTVSVTADANAGIKFMIVSSGVKAGGSSESKIKLTFSAAPPDRPIHGDDGPRFVLG